MVLSFDLFIWPCWILMAACGIFLVAAWKLLVVAHELPSSLTRDQMEAPCIGKAVLATGRPEKSLKDK